jgi:hypothetical protein
MVLALAISSGIREENTLIAIVILMGLTQCSALVVELATTRVPSKKAGGDSEQLMTTTTAQSQVGNYFKRTAPALLGVVPYVACWAIIINSFSNAASAASAEGSSVPSFVYIALSGTVVIFTLFALPFFVYQAIDVEDYWETELWYRCAAPRNPAVDCLVPSNAASHPSNRIATPNRANYKPHARPGSQFAFVDVQDVPGSPAFRGKRPLPGCPRCPAAPAARLPRAKPSALGLRTCSCGRTSTRRCPNRATSAS